ncbi:hypothetical protein [Mesorhizobium sp.]|uniref:hypothetical protein n=1 Tax=Mesorhizobium sp. TaxID=1871066 RepID=UPI001214903D|nr:hypothetical protein [Mesorhizobium sp.]TIQ05721.1 MAG: hypothetical protein E5X50_19715 [Mesorhizobium sp.]
MTKRTHHVSAQLDLLDWAESRPTAKIISALPGIYKRMWRERHMQQPHNDPHIVPLRRRA